MKIKVAFEVDTPKEAREILAAVERLTGLPYRLDGYGGSVLKETPPHAVDVEEDATPTAPEPPTERPNINPGYTACSRIGSDTKEALLKELPGRANDPEHIGKKIKRNAEQTKQLIQLMWDRGEIKFDGEDFYL